MFIAHLPSGVLLARAAVMRLQEVASQRALIAAALSGSLFPDTDLFWNFLVDDGQVHHHRYWTHTPAVWLVIGALGCLLLARRRRLRALLAVFVAGVFAHLCLDSVVGDVRWLWPLSDELFSLFTVPARYSHYIISFVLHWTFAIELVICTAAAMTLHRWRAAVRAQ